MGILEGIILLVAGMAAGGINVFAGGGSLLTLPLLIFLGYPSAVANGTNKVAMTFGSMTTAANFIGKKQVTIEESLILLPALVIGSFIGSRLAIDIPDALFKIILSVVMVAVLVVILFKPQEKMPREKLQGKVKIVVQQIAFLLIGFYGGFIMVGMGYLFMTVLSLLTEKNTTQINAQKVLLAGMLTLVSLGVFFWEGHVEWIPGLILTAGYSTGGYLASHLAIKGGEKYVKPVLVVAVLLMATRLAGLWDLVGNWLFPQSS